MRLSSSRLHLVARMRSLCSCTWRAGVAILRVSAERLTSEPPAVACLLTHGSTVALAREGSLLSESLVGTP